MEIKIIDEEEENISINHTTYTLEYKGFKVVVERRKQFSDEVGEIEDEIDIMRQDKQLSEEEIEEIEDFIREQD